MIGLVQTVAPTQDPVNLDEVKEFLRVDHNEEDIKIDGLIKAATNEVENITNRQLVSATWIYSLAGFPHEIRLPKPPLIAVGTIAYVDQAGDNQTLDSSVYQLVSSETKARLVEAYNQQWPSTRAQPEAVTITYTSGYGNPSSVPESIKTAIKIIVQQLFDQTMAQAPIQALLASHRVQRFS